MLKMEKILTLALKDYVLKKLLKTLEKKYDLVIAQHQNNYYKGIKKDVNAALSKGPTTLDQLNENLEKEGSIYRIKKSPRGFVYFKTGKESNQISRLYNSSKFKNLGLDKKGLEATF